MALYHQDIVNIDLNSGNIHRSFLRHSIGKADKDANRFGVRVFRGKEPVDLTNAVCQGFFRNSNGENIALTAHGTVSGNVAFVTLPQACYNYEGVFCLSIKLIGGGITGTMRIVDGMVDNTNTGDAVAPTQTVPSYQEIIAQYDNLLTAIDTATAVTMKNNAAIENPVKIKAAELEQGTFNSGTGAKVDSNTRIRFAYSKTVKKGTCIMFTPGEIIEKYVATVFDADGNALRIYSDWLTDSVLPLEFSAETGYLMMAFANGNDAAVVPEDLDAEVQIVNYEVYTQKIELEKGALDSSSGNRFSLNLARHGTNMRNKYPLMLDGAKIIIVPQMTSSAVAFFADEDGAYVESVNLNTLRNTIIPVPDDAVYMDIDISNQDNEKIEIEAFGGECPYSGKRIYRYSGNTIIADFDVENETTFSCMSFDLPPNYEAEGKKVPIFLWFAGTGGYPNILSVFQSAETRRGLEYMRDEGYAVIQIFPIGKYYSDKYPNAAKDQPYPIPVCENCIRSGIKYFADRYNVDADNINVLGLSFGGIMGFHYTLRPLPGMKSVTLFDPCIDTLSMRGRFSDSRQLLAEELEMTGDHVEDFFDINEDGTTQTGVENYYFSERCQPVWEDNIPALIRINPAWDNYLAETNAQNYAKSIADAREWWRNGKHEATDIYDDPEFKMISGVPLKIIGAMDDDSTAHQIMLEKVEQLRNAGNPAEIHMVPYGGHCSTSINPETPWVEDITTVLDIEYEDMRIGWIEAVKWARKNC